MRLRELRRLQTMQKGGSGLPKELPRLSPKVTRDIGGKPFGCLGGGNYLSLEAKWFPKQTQAGDCVLSQNTAKPMRFLGFGYMLWLWRIGESRNCSKRLLNDLKTRPKYFKRAEKAPDSAKRRLRAAQRAATIVSQDHKGHQRDGFWPPWGRQLSKFGGNMVSKTDRSCRLYPRTNNIAKLFFCFGSLFWLWGVGNSRNCSKRRLNDLKTCSKCG